MQEGNTMRNMMQKKTLSVTGYLVGLAVIALLILALAACTTYRLERGLPKDIKEWYDTHSIWMEYGKVPEWIDEHNDSERSHFLRLPEKLQREYIKYFWRMRRLGCAEVYYERIEAADELFRSEGRAGRDTDRGKVMLLCGMPTCVDWYYEGHRTIESSMPQTGYFQVWTYVQWGAAYCRYIFEYREPNTWRLSFNSVFDMGNQLQVERYWRKLFAPTEDGWAAWGNRLATLLSNKESRKESNKEQK